MPDVRHFNECILIHAAKRPLIEGTAIDDLTFVPLTKDKRWL